MSEICRRPTKRPLAGTNHYLSNFKETTIHEESKSEQSPLKRFPEAWMNEQATESSPKRLRPFSGQENESGEVETETNPVKSPEKEDPLTPMANLKILLTALSPALRDREESKRRNLTREFLASAGDDDENDEKQEEDALKSEKPSDYSRKDKSLAKLCTKFLEGYDREENAGKRIFLDEVGRRLGVERRRIYDIINVLESLEMTKRVAKNQYIWYGRTRLPATLSKLKAHALQKGLLLPKVNLQQKEESSVEKLRENIKKIQNRGDDSEDESKVPADKRVRTLFERRDRSLGCLTQRFLMLFFVSDTKIVGLDVAALILIGNMSPESSKWKTKVRRLYDIANILSSLELIKKVKLPLRYGMKPAYEWVGFDLDCASQQFVATEKNPFFVRKRPLPSEVRARRSTYTKKHTLLENFEAIPVDSDSTGSAKQQLASSRSTGIPLAVTPSQLQTAAALMQLKTAHAAQPAPSVPRSIPLAAPSVPLKPVLIPMQTSVLSSGQLLIPVQNPLHPSRFNGMTTIAGSSTPLVVSLIPTAVKTSSGTTLLQLSVQPQPPSNAAPAKPRIVPKTPQPSKEDVEEVAKMRDQFKSIHSLLNQNQNPERKKMEMTEGVERFSPDYGKPVQAPLRFHQYTPNGKQIHTQFLSPNSTKQVQHLQCQEQLSPSTPKQADKAGRSLCGTTPVRPVGLTPINLSQQRMMLDGNGGIPLKTLQNVDKKLLGFWLDHAPLCTRRSSGIGCNL
eukprot:m.24701 g.24701  ORF g.24701 m.24701 type:complete len:737 (+) comp28673_c0_seq3:20-2230(+)